VPVPEVSIRYATAPDGPSIVELIERAYRGPEAATAWTNETEFLTGPRTRDGEVDRLVADPESRFVLAEVAGELAGCALVQRADQGAYFGMFAVDPRQQGGGVGKAVLDACEETARELWAAGSMRLTVISLRADLIDWYARRGYLPDGTREPFPFHVESGALRTDFDLVRLVKAL
jgi:ribosomal protein S18 acetylase RimI-like enzyme